jgi:ABC-type phosphate transport system ATPase subunit
VIIVTHSMSLAARIADEKTVIAQRPVVEADRWRRSSSSALTSAPRITWRAVRLMAGQLPAVSAGRLG